MYREILVLLCLIVCLNANVSEAGELPELPISESSLQLLAGIIVMLFFLLGFVLYYRVFDNASNEAIAGMAKLERPNAPKAKAKKNADEEVILNILRQNGGKRTQLQIRGILNCSQQKCNLLLSSLESQKKIKKIKQKRSTIIQMLD